MTTLEILQKLSAELDAAIMELRNAREVWGWKR